MNQPIYFQNLMNGTDSSSQASLQYSHYQPQIIV